jgi:hypothetical protein
MVFVVVWVWALGPLLVWLAVWCAWDWWRVRAVRRRVLSRRVALLAVDAVVWSFADYVAGDDAW